MSAEPMFIRIIDPQRTFHTHGIPCGFGNRHGLQVRTWAGGRRKLHQAYRNLRRSGIGREDARGFVIDLMLVAPVHQFSPRCLHAAVANPALTPAPPADVERGEIFQPDHIELALARELANGTINADLYVRVIGIVPDERRPAKVLTAYLAGVR